MSDWSAYPEVTPPPSNPARITVRPEWDAYPEVGAVATAKDVAHSTGTGIAEGTIGLAGAGGDAGSLISAGVDAAGNYLGIDPERLQRAKAAISGGVSKIPVANILTGPGSADIQKRVEGYTGEFYKPQTTSGEYARTIGSFIPGALLGPAGEIGAVGSTARTVAQRAGGDLLRYGVAPGVVSEAAGQYVRETNPELEPAVRTGAAFAAGGVASLLAPGRTIPKAILSQLPEYVTPRDVKAADILIQRAASGPNPVQLSWPQALTTVTKRPVMLDMQRILESARPSRGMMQEFFAPQAGQFEQRARQELGTVAPPPVDPNTVGPSIQRAAEKTVEDMREAMTKATKPLYDAAKQTLVPQQVHAAMIQDPLFAKTLKELRDPNFPERGANIRGLSDRNVMVYDAIKKRLREKAENASSPFSQDKSQETAGTFGTAASDVRNVAAVASRTAGPSAYEAALAGQKTLRENYLNPLLQGYIGKLRDKNLTTDRAIEALFPSQPSADSARAISKAVSELQAQNPTAASQLVRAHVLGTLDQAATATQKTIGDVNPAVGGKFWVNLVGNPQQRANIQAGVEALPNGKVKWQGIQNLLDIAKATAMRQDKGSLTAFNPEDIASLGGGNKASELATTLASPGLWTKIVKDTYTKWQVGHNFKGLAHIMTDPRAGPLLERLASMPRHSSEAGAITARLMLLGDAATAGGPRVPQQPQ